MTAEIAILNRSGVALAADSALTVGKERVWKHTNKLYSISNHNDIAIMIYGNGDFCGVPWEIIIKEFRRKIARKAYQKISDCTQDFFDFLRIFEPIDAELIGLNTWSIFLNIIRTIDQKIPDCQKTEYKNMYLNEIEKYKDKIEEIVQIDDSLGQKEFDSIFGETIRGFLDEILECRVTKELANRIKELCWMAYQREMISNLQTGVVFAGYGQNEIYPVVEHWLVDGKDKYGLRCWKHDFTDLNLPGTGNACIMPFAQKDISYLFIEGIQEDYLKYIEDTLQRVLDHKSDYLISQYVDENSRFVESNLEKAKNKEAVKKFLEEFTKTRNETVVNRILRVVASLPKEEMATMAEAFIEITSLRRKVDSLLESVGGPIDVALISKGDGFIWMKRKHYFDSNINQDFLVKRNYFGKEPTDE